mmetsp:Transcript_19094/g.59394  ORF Transcript_19094/g.59394 Transcript_19094/m.59394 type:complete len:241 (+) Transcript_19094:370-1092(+)
MATKCIKGGMISATTLPGPAPTRATARPMLGTAVATPASAATVATRAAVRRFSAAACASSGSRPTMLATCARSHPNGPGWTPSVCGGGMPSRRSSMMLTAGISCSGNVKRTDPHSNMLTTFMSNPRACSSAVMGTSAMSPKAAYEISPTLSSTAATTTKAASITRRKSSEFCMPALTGRMSVCPSKLYRHEPTNKGTVASSAAGRPSSLAMAAPSVLTCWLAHANTVPSASSVAALAAVL